MVENLIWGDLAFYGGTWKPLRNHVKSGLLNPFLIQIEKLCYAKICGERTLFHDFVNNCPGKIENLRPQGSLCVLLLYFLFRSSSQKVLLKVAVLKFCKIPLETPVVDFCCSCWAWTFIFTEIELCSMLSLQFKSSYFSSLIDCCNQKQPPEMFYKKAVFENFAILTGKHVCWSLFLIK